MNKSESKYFNTAAKMDLALIALLKKKPFEYITVSELCKTAGVNRSTFYLHYETVADLLNETVRYLLNDFLANFSNDTKAVAFDLSGCELDELVFIRDRYLLPYLTYIKNNKEIFLTALLHKETFGFESVYQRMFENIFNPILERFHYPQEYRQYVMLYYLNGVHAIVLQWIKEGCQRSIEEISKMIEICIYGFDCEFTREGR